MTGGMRGAINPGDVCLVVAGVHGITSTGSCCTCLLGRVVRVHQRIFDHTLQSVCWTFDETVMCKVAHREIPSADERTLRPLPGPHELARFDERHRELLPAVISSVKTHRAKIPT